MASFVSFLSTLEHYKTIRSIASQWKIFMHQTKYTHLYIRVMYPIPYFSETKIYSFILLK